MRSKYSMAVLSLMLSASMASAALAGAAGVAPKVYPSPGEIVAAAPTSDWVVIDPKDLLVMDLAPDAKGKPRRVVIQLMPVPFSQGWIGNIRKLAAAKFWDGTSINRVQDNYVVQWGDAAEDESAKKPLPAGLAVMPESEYRVNSRQIPVRRVVKKLNADAYSKAAFLWNGWPVASNSTSLWPVHCYGMVGVGRGLSPDTGSGAELYTVIGHAPRHLDRNIAIVGRVIEGIENLSSLPRGTGGLGFYETAEERTAIISVRIGDELAADALPHFEYLNTDSNSFSAYADARANRRDPFFIKPAGGADICNIPVPVRRVK